MRNRKQLRPTLLVMIALLLILSLAPIATAVSTTTTQIAMTIDNLYTMVNNQTLVLDTPPLLINGKVFIPAKNTSDYMGLNLAWNPKIKMVEVKTAKVYIQFDIDNKQVMVNGIVRPFEEVAAMSNGKLLVKLDWFCDFMGAKQTYNPLTKRIDIIYVKVPDELSDSANSSRPVAKFTFTKSTYRLGETVKYVDLSYDPDAEGIARYEWTGKKDVFFIPGKYPITLKVYDNAKNVSSVYTRTINIENITYMNEVQYKIYNQPAGTLFNLNWQMIYSNFWDLPMLTKQVSQNSSRSLLVSDSPETIKEKGILYQDNVNGKARLYADHINGTPEKIQFTIMARNTTKAPVTILTTNRGEVYPSIYANLIGHEASVDFMLYDPIDTIPLVIPAGQTLVYVQMPEFYPGQGVNVFYDIETDGKIEFSFVAGQSGSATATSLGDYKPLPFDGHVRGTFPVADMTWEVNLSDFTQPSRLTIGDGISDPFIKGYDTERKKEVLNEGNYGVIYKIHADKPRKMAVLLFPKGGPFKGPFKIDGQFTMAPASGVLQAFDHMQVLARTTGEEDSFTLEFTPPAGSAFPVDIIFYPLGDEPK